MADRFDTCRIYRAILFLYHTEIYTVPTRFFESLNEQNWMCELCTFPKYGHICIATLLAESDYKLKLTINMLPTDGLNVFKVSFISLLDFEAVTAISLATII